MPIRLTQAVKVLLILNFGAFLVQQTADQFFGTHLMGWFALTPSALTSLHLWQIFSYSFMHTDVTHLIFNLMMIYFIGSELEMVWGMTRFLKYYFFCATSAALIYLGLQFVFLKTGGTYRPMIGASGAIYGLLVAYGLFFGERVLLFMMLFPMKAKHFVCLLALIELLTTLYSSGGIWAGAAQMGGMIAGFGYLWVRATLNQSKKKRNGSLRQKKIRSHHLKLIVNNDSAIESLDDDSSDNPKTWH